MIFFFACVGCGTELKIENAKPGEHAQCPQCGIALKVPRGELGPGVTLGGFELESLLNKGGMGEVYLARQVSLDRKVALKILPSQYSRLQEDVDRFLLEVRTLAKLEHPNIVTAYEAGEDGGVLYLAMAYVAGVSVEDRLKSSGAFSETEALQIVRKVALALTYAWNEHKILHRDIKPGNILLDRQGEPKVADLGIAKSIGHGTDLTLVPTLLGSPNYMSPEQANGMDLDFRSDMYSLGATLYHMLTGTLPFGSTTLMETLRKQAADGLPDPRKAQPKLSRGTLVLLEQMLARDRANRPESWEALNSDLLRVQHGNLPQKLALKPGQSVIRREQNTVATRIHRSTQAATVGGVASPPQSDGGSSKIFVAVVALGLLGVGLGIWFMNGGPRHECAPEPVLLPALTDRSSVVAKQFESALQFSHEHKGEYREAMNRFREVMLAGAGTDYAKQATEKIKELETEQRVTTEEVMKKLTSEAEALVRQEKWIEAVSGVRAYAGLLTVETFEAREQLAKNLKKRADEATEARTKLATVTKENLKQVEITLAELLLKNDGGGIQKLITDSDAALAPVAEEWQPFKAGVEKAAGMSHAVLESFRKDSGKEVTVALKWGRETLRIAGIEGAVVKADRVVREDGGAKALTPKNFTYSDLSGSEKLQRAGGGNASEASVFKGLLAWECKNCELARKCFEESGSVLGLLLADRAKEVAIAQQAASAAQGNAAAETAAAQAYRMLIMAACPELPVTAEVEATLTAIGARKYRDTQCRAIAFQLAALGPKFPNTAFGKSKEAVIQALAAVKPASEARDPDALATGAGGDMTCQMDLKSKRVEFKANEHPSDDPRKRSKFSRNCLEILILSHSYADYHLTFGRYTWAHDCRFRWRLEPTDPKTPLPQYSLGIIPLGSSNGGRSVLTGPDSGTWRLPAFDANYDVKNSGPARAVFRADGVYEVCVEKIGATVCFWVNGQKVSEIALNDMQMIEVAKQPLSLNLAYSSQAETGIKCTLLELQRGAHLTAYHGGAKAP